MRIRITDYLEPTKWLAVALKSEGKGASSRLAKALGIPASYVSQIISGDKPFTVERALEVASYFKLNTVDTEYLVGLVQYCNASSEITKTFFLTHLKGLREKNLKLSMSDHVHVDQKARDIFFSAWYYSGILLLAQIKGFQEPLSISKRLNLPIEIVTQTLDFLVSIGYCEQSGTTYRVLINRVHLENSEYALTQHHFNWRLKGFEKKIEKKINNFYFSTPMVIGTKDKELIRTMLIDVLNKIDAVIQTSPSEELVCLNIDWFGF